MFPFTCNRSLFDTYTIGIIIIFQVFLYVVFALFDVAFVAHRALLAGWLIFLYRLVVAFLVYGKRFVICTHGYIFCQIA